MSLPCPHNNDFFVVNIESQWQRFRSLKVTSHWSSLCCVWPCPISPTTMQRRKWGWNGRPKTTLGLEASRIWGSNLSFLCTKIIQFWFRGFVFDMVNFPQKVCVLADCQFLRVHTNEKPGLLSPLFLDLAGHNFESVEKMFPFQISKFHLWENVHLYTTTHTNHCPFGTHTIQDFKATILPLNTKFYHKHSPSWACCAFPISQLDQLNYVCSGMWSVPT